MGERRDRLLTFWEMERLLERITYKPGVRLSIWRSVHDERLTLGIIAAVPSVDDPSRTIEIQSTVSLPAWQLGEAGILRKVRRLVKELENHEVDEWLRVDGVPVRDPHPGPSGPV